MVDAVFVTLNATFVILSEVEGSVNVCKTIAQA